MRPEHHLTSHSRMSGSRWVITPCWLSGLLRPFLYSSVYSWHLFLISLASVRSLLFLSFIVPIFAWSIHFILLIFLKRSLVSSSIFLHCSFKKTFLSLLSILWISAFSWDIFPFLPCLSLLFFAQQCVKPPQTTTLLSCTSFSLEWSQPSVQYHKRYP